MIFMKPSSPLGVTFQPAFCKHLYRPCQSECLQLFAMMAVQITTETSCWTFPTLFRTYFCPITVKKNMSKRKAESDSKRQFNELWENEFLFIASPS
ncbi:uncharacterized protein LOC143244793 isoform X2 [Tachypleus tridentatus]|uniref:uncharacterized protein LOC143244793 isoform X2 n=1 Tax=Tachypleus tridentatus TaxID=6853 RepID=UPI003FD188F3